MSKKLKLSAALTSGLLTALTFPNFNLSGLAWISYIPLLWVVFNSSRKKSFVFGVISGITSFLIILYWLIPTFSAAGEPIVLGIISLLLLCLCLALFQGFACFITGFFCETFPDNKKVILLAPLSLTGCELLRTYLFGGFPWALTGHSQWNCITIIQISDITGVYGISFVIFLFNTLLAYILNELIKREKILLVLKKTFSYIFITLIIFLSINFYGTHLIKKYSTIKNAITYKAALLQGNIDQYKKWDKDFVEEIFSTYEYLSTVASKSRPDIIIWPESALPGILSVDKELNKKTISHIRKTGTNHLIGTVDLRKDGYYNSAFLFNPNGEIISRYDKNHLVIFGETIPLKSFLGKFIKTLNELGEINSGNNFNVFQTANAKFGTSICFESIFPDICRKLTRNSAGFLVNLTNDAWYLNTSAPYQHFIFNVFRAVENRRPLLRCANTGISGEIDACGRIIQKTNIFTTAILISDVKIPAENKITFYTRYGDLFSLICLLASLAFFLTTYLNFRKMTLQPKAKCHPEPV